jgi:WD40 repeat protein
LEPLKAIGFWLRPSYPDEQAFQTQASNVALFLPQEFTMRAAKTVTGPILLVCFAMAGGEPAARETPRAEAKKPGHGQKNGNQRHVGPLYVEITVGVFSPNNKYLLAGFSGGKKLLTLWEVNTGKEVRSFQGPTDMVTGVAFVSGGKRALSASRDGTLFLHEIDTGKLVRETRAYHHSAHGLAVSADGKLALTVGTHKAAVGPFKLWDTDTLVALRSFGASEDAGAALAISPDHRFGLSSPLLRLWNLETGKLVHIPHEKDDWNGRVGAFSPDSKLALVAQWTYEEKKDRASTRLGLWALDSGKILRVFQGTGGLVAQFTPDSKRVIGFANHTESGTWIDFFGKGPLNVGIWDAASGKLLRAVPITLRSPKEAVHVLNFSPDGRLVLVGAGGVYERPAGKDNPPEAEMSLAVWDLATGRPLCEWTRPPADVEPWSF